MKGITTVASLNPCSEVVLYSGSRSSGKSILNSIDNSNWISAINWIRGSGTTIISSNINGGRVITYRKFVRPFNSFIRDKKVRKEFYDIMHELNPHIRKQNSSYMTSAGLLSAALNMFFGLPEDEKHGIKFYIDNFEEHGTMEDFMDVLRNYLNIMKV